MSGHIRPGHSQSLTEQHRSSPSGEGAPRTMREHALHDGAEIRSRSPASPEAKRVHEAHLYVIRSVSMHIQQLRKDQLALQEGGADHEIAA